MNRFIAATVLLLPLMLSPTLAEDRATRVFRTFDGRSDITIRGNGRAEFRVEDSKYVGTYEVQSDTLVLSLRNDNRPKTLRLTRLSDDRGWASRADDSSYLSEFLSESALEAASQPAALVARLKDGPCRVAALVALSQLETETLRAHQAALTSCLASENGNTSEGAAFLLAGIGAATKLTSVKQAERLLYHYGLGFDSEYRLGSHSNALFPERAQLVDRICLSEDGRRVCKPAIVFTATIAALGLPPELRSRETPPVLDDAEAAVWRAFVGSISGETRSSYGRESEVRDLMTRLSESGELDTQLVLGEPRTLEHRGKPCVATDLRLRIRDDDPHEGVTIASCVRSRDSD